MGRRRCAAVRGRDAFTRPPRSDHAALGGLAGAAARAWSDSRSRWSRPGPGGHPSFGTVATRDWRPAAVASGRDSDATVPPPRSPGSRWRPPARDRDAADDRLRDLPPARGVRALAGEPPRRAGGRRARARPRRATRCRSSSCARDKHYFFGDDRRAFVGYRIENGVLLLSGDPVGPRGRAAAACSSESARVRRRARPEARRGRRERAAVPAVRGARAADDLPRRRGGRRARPLLARGPPDPQGAPVGHPPEQGRIRRRAARCSRALDAGDDRARSRRCSSSGARAPPSAASRWRWTRSTASTSDETLVVLARDEDGAIRGVLHFVPVLRPRRRCRCRSCAATRTRRMG